MKKCSKCAEIKSLDKFRKKKESKDGRRADCKSCNDVLATHKPNKDLRGMTFELLYVTDNPPIYDNPSKRYKWLCKCECGNLKYVIGGKLTSGQIKSCGCLGKHGHASDDEKSAEYHSWSGMLSRCNNPNNKFYNYYGGRGIKVCDRWLNFVNFLNDMGEKPHPSYSIDRVDNNKGYHPDNCVWADKTTQARNQRLSKTNKSGYKGVHKTKEGVWETKITVNYKSIYLGKFKDESGAIKARRKAEEKYFNTST